MDFLKILGSVALGVATHKEGGFNCVVDKPRDSYVVNELIRSFSEDGKKVVPVPGSILYCKLGDFEHSGVYIGGGRIVELNGEGRVVEVSAEKFVDNVLTLDTDIYVSSTADGLRAIGSSKVARLAKTMLGDKRDYNIVLDNCHQFTAGCILNNFENPDNFLFFLKDTVETEMNNGDTVNWVVWDR